MPEDPPPESSGQDSGADASVRELRLTDTQRQILAALCRPCIGENRYATPATNQAIAAEVYLSVDAVKAHLRALYRKFGVEPLPHNQKRARLVELVLEGGLLSEQATAEADAAARPAAPPPPAPPPPGRGGPLRGNRALLGIALGLTVVAAAIALIVILSGDSGSESQADSLSKAEYVAAVNGYCERALDGLALVGNKRLAAASTARRAQAYLGVIASVRGDVESLAPPPGPNRALERFRAGLDRAARFTSVVADRAPAPGTSGSANVVAELTFAAGQVQAGALGYKLGDCSGVGDVVARSAANAAGTP